MKKILFLITFCISSLANNISNQDLNLNGSVKTYTKAMISTEDYIKVSLVDVVLETVSQSNNAKAAREKVKQAKLKIDYAKADYLPSVNGQYKLSRTESKPGDDGEGNKYFNDESYKLSVNQNIYKGGATRNEVQSLEKKYEIEKNNYRLVIAKEIENAIKAYFDVLFNYQSFNVNVENMERLNEILEIINIKYESGAASIGNLSNVKASVSNAESKLIRVQSKFNESLEFYLYIVGDEFIKTFPFEDEFDTNVDDFENIVNQSILNNMKIKNYDLKIATEKFNLLKAKSPFKPKVDLELSGEQILDEEDYVEDSRNYKAQVLMSYNFYNKGKDKNKILQLNSKIRELKFRKKEEIRKLKWSLSKLHRSIISIADASVSKEKEVVASKEMVVAYWDGFKLGEQDLQELLQGQRQLNSAQIELIENKKSTITDYFKLLSNTGELLNYFRLDIESDDFIDFTKSDYRNLLTKELNDDDENILKDEFSSSNEIKEENSAIDIIEKDTNTTKPIEPVIEDIKPIVEKDSIDDLLNYEKIFLESPVTKWTIWIHDFEKVYNALEFAKVKNMSDNIFIFDTLKNNRIKSNIAYDIYDTEEIATEVMNDLNITKKSKKVVNTEYIINKYKDFKNKKLETKRKVKKVKKFETDAIFKKKFLTSDKNNYTINISSFSSIDEAKKLILDENIVKNSFVFNYGDEKEWTKVMYGVFTSYDEANDALEQLNNIKEKYEPIIELLDSKQKLYYKYNTYNPLEEIKNEVSKETIQEKPIVVINEIEGDFKETFLNAPENRFTINLATLLDEESVRRFTKRYKNKINFFIFKFGADKTYYKVMTGVFTSKSEAYNTIENLDDRLKRNKPRVENIQIKQKLYFKYNKDSIEKENIVEVE